MVYASERGQVRALESIDLDVRDGEFVSLLGPSGCGKSTLLMCIAGLRTPSRGGIHISGTAVTRPLTDLGIVFQRDVLLDWRSALDNVLLGADFRRVSRRSRKGAARELLRRLGLQGYEDLYPWELSGGMRQRVAICRALLFDPQLLLMDEPFAALDAFTRDDLNLELERLWNETRKTVLFVTHSIAEAVFLSDRVVVMSRSPGRIIQHLTVELPRPRRLEIRETPEFNQYVARIRGAFERPSG